jgi:antitoxin HicB
MMIGYRIDTEPDDNGTVVVTCPAFPELTTFAEPEEGAILRHASDAVEEAIAARIHDGDPVPRPDADRGRRGQLWVKLPLLTALKAELYTALRDSSMTRAELARRLDWHRQQVDRLFNLDHASRLDQIEAAFQALRRDIDVRILKQKIPAG